LAYCTNKRRGRSFGDLRYPAVLFSFSSGAGGERRGQPASQLPLENGEEEELNTICHSSGIQEQFTFFVTRIEDDITHDGGVQESLLVKVGLVQKVVCY